MSKESRIIDFAGAKKGIERQREIERRSDSGPKEWIIYKPPKITGDMSLGEVSEDGQDLGRKIIDLFSLDAK